MYMYMYVKYKIMKYEGEEGNHITVHSKFPFNKILWQVLYFLTFQMKPVFRNIGIDIVNFNKCRVH